MPPARASIIALSEAIFVLVNRRDVVDEENERLALRATYGERSGSALERMCHPFGNNLARGPSWDDRLRR
jgi:hypothetical protein